MAKMTNKYAKGYTTQHIAKGVVSYGIEEARHIQKISDTDGLIPGASLDLILHGVSMGSNSLTSLSQLLDKDNTHAYACRDKDTLCEVVVRAGVLRQLSSNIAEFHDGSHMLGLRWNYGINKAPEAVVVELLRLTSKTIVFGDNNPNGKMTFKSQGERDIYLAVVFDHIVVLHRDDYKTTLDLYVSGKMEDDAIMLSLPDRSKYANHGYNTHFVPHKTK